MSPRAFAVSADCSFVDGYAHPTVFRGGRPVPLLEVAERVSRAAGERCAGVVLVVDVSALELLGLPVRLEGGKSAAIDAVRAAGWRATELRHWTSLWPGDRALSPVHMVVPSWVDQRVPAGATYTHGELIVPEDLGTTTYRLARWAELTGGPFLLKAGWSAIEWVRERKYPRGAPLWRGRYTGNLANAVRHGEKAFAWEAPAQVPPPAHVHRYDGYAAYLAAAQLAPVALEQLTRSGKTFDKSRAGYWLCTVGPWQHPGPDPLAGNVPDEKGRYWLCTPTLGFLLERAEEGACAAPTIHDSYTAPGSRKILRPWAEQLRDALAELARSPLDPDDAALTRAVKASFREAIGLFAHQGTPVYRPDWHHSVLSQARASLLRRVWNIGLAEGRWPLAIDTDALDYGSDDPDCSSACPAGLRLGVGLGMFRVKCEHPALVSA